MKYVEGNLIEMADAGKFDVIIHGCNCFKRMKSGVALAVKTRWPGAERADTHYFREPGDRATLGEYSFVITDISSGAVDGHPGWLRIINAYTQYTNLDEDIYTGREDLFNLRAFTKAMYFIRERFGTQRIGIPKIGSHLAGGDWNIIEQIVDGFEFQDLTCVVLPENPK